MRAGGNERWRAALHGERGTEPISMDKRKGEEQTD